MVWSKFGINYTPAFLARGVSERSHCAVVVKKSQYLKYMHRYMHAYIHIYSHTGMQREKRM